MPKFELVSPHTPKGDQPGAIETLVKGIEDGETHQVLLGVTGSGKTFTVANVIERTQRPALVMAPNKTLAAQLYTELETLFPNNAVAYFVSYYDYYQPEAYVPNTDTFIEKDAIVNEKIDRMRHAATMALLSREDVIIVASVSCIYGIGSSEWYAGMVIQIDVGKTVRRDALLRQLVDIQFKRNDIDFHRGTFRVRGDVVEIFPTYAEDKAIRIEFWGDEVEAISEIDPLRGKVLVAMDTCSIYPASHYVTPEEQRKKAVVSIQDELQVHLKTLEAEGKLLERQRLEQRTLYDLEMIEQMGFCYGIENYSRHLSGRGPGEASPTLLDYFPKDFITIVDESHQTIPQIGAMYRGDRARKMTLVDHGFRMPSALDNRPLQFEEWEERVGQMILVSATPGKWELDQTGGALSEQLLRPTGLLDPTIEIIPVKHQVDVLLDRIRERIDKDERVLVTTLTKRMSEDLTEYYSDIGLKVRYLHSDIDTLERIEILRDLRRGEFDVLIGINLLREGLDLPEVSLVAILDADKEGFLRSERSLIQTIGRAARNASGHVIMFADKITNSMELAIGETERRRALQHEHNQKTGIVPQTIRKAIRARDGEDSVKGTEAAWKTMSEPELRAEMAISAEALDFERAAKIRDVIKARYG